MRYGELCVGDTLADRGQLNLIVDVYYTGRGMLRFRCVELTGLSEIIYHAAADTDVSTRMIVYRGSS